MASPDITIRIEPVTDLNCPAVLALRAAPGQEGFVESPRRCLEEASALSLWRPVGLYAEDCLVGFAMYGFFPHEGQDEEMSEGGRVWLDRLLIDASCQGKGYGKAAVKALIRRLRQEYGCRRIFLSVYKENQAACRLYERLGFRFNGETDANGELVMCKDCTA